MSLADLPALRRALGRMDVPLVGAAALLLLAQTVTIAIRWAVIANLVGVRMRVGQSLHWVLVGQFLNLALPTSIGGDGFRVWKLHREAPAPIGRALMTVVIERGTGLVLLALLVSACSLGIRGLVTTEQFLMLAGLGPALTLPVAALWFMPRWGRSLPYTRVQALCSRIAEVTAFLKRSPVQTAAVLVLGLLGSALGLLAAWVLTLALGMDLGIAPVMALVGTAALAAVLPISFGGWGVREASMVGLFSLVGVPAETTIALSLVWSLLPAVISAPAAVHWTCVQSVPVNEDSNRQ